MNDADRRHGNVYNLHNVCSISEIECPQSLPLAFTFRTLEHNWFIYSNIGCLCTSYFCDDVEDLLEDVVLGHVLCDGNVVGALLVIPCRLVHVEHLGEGSRMTSAEKEGMGH